MDGPDAHLKSTLSRVAVRVVAFYLPQFHPTPENDAWWGKGFTEWTNVTKAEPLFDGHYQPHLPTDFGFYDLRVRQTRRDQINVAQAHGVDAFCYHYYWFSGRRLLHEPFDDMLRDPESTMPFCICWANESWTRRWDAADHKVLIEQRYLPGDAQKFIADIEPILRDFRYIKVDGRPILIVYRVQHIPNVLSVVATWRQHCRDVGIGEIHICAALTHGNEEYMKYGCDSGVEFPPHNMRCESVAAKINFKSAFFGYAMQYADIAYSFLNRQYVHGSRIFKTVFPSWDNTARTGARAVFVLNGTPNNFGRWLGETLALAGKQAPQLEQLVFINAWNEWAEGCHLEPDRRYGDGFLKALQAAKLHQTYADAFVEESLASTDLGNRKFTQDVIGVLAYHLGVILGATRNRINRAPWLRKLVMPIVRFWKRWTR